MSQTKIIEFLIKAKKATYAGYGSETTPSRLNSHDLEFREGELYYLDTYLGGSNFAGEEAVWEKNLPIWSMNYCGRILAPGFDGDFLKEALTHVSSELPYRGPASYQKEQLIYNCSIEGDFDWFNGYEAIYYEELKVYECYFHGGKIA